AQAVALLVVVLDDAVVHHRQLAEAHVRVGIVFGDAAMGGPARVADAESGAEAFGLRRRLHLRDAAGPAHPAHSLTVEHGNAGRIVAAIFQSLQTLDQGRYHVAIGDRTHNSAHGPGPPGNRRAV